jgi:hypothetical protein
MERTLISFNVPNLITVPLMAFGGFLLAAIIWQFAQKSGFGRGSQGA